MADDHDEYRPEQSGMYELEFPAPQLSSPDGRGPVMIHALEGFSDAGHAIRLAVEASSATRSTPSWSRRSRSTNCWTTGRAGR